MSLNLSPDTKNILEKSKLDKDTEELMTSSAAETELNSVITGVCAKYHSSYSPSLSTEYTTKDMLRPGQEHITAYTQGDIIHENLGHDLVLSGRDLDTRWLNAVGMLIHELSHVCYTDCKGRAEYLEALQNKGIFPTLKTDGKDKKWKDNYNLLLNDLKSADIKYGMANFLAQYENIIEDGYIEKKYLDNFTGTTALALKVLRANFLDDMKSVKEIDANYDSQIKTNPMVAIETLFNASLEIAKYGDLKDAHKVDLNQSSTYNLIKPSIPYIQAALASDNALARRTAIMESFVSCYDVISDAIKKAVADNKQQQNGQNGQGMPMPGAGAGAGIPMPMPGQGGQPLTKQQQKALQDAWDKLPQDIKDKFEKNMTPEPSDDGSSNGPLDQSQLNPNSGKGGNGGAGGNKGKMPTKKTELNVRDKKALDNLLKGDKKDKEAKKHANDIIDKISKQLQQGQKGYSNYERMEDIEFDIEPYDPSMKRLYISNYSKFAEQGKRIANEIREKIEAYGQGETLARQMAGDLDVENSAIEAIINQDTRFFSTFRNPDERAPANIAICIDVSGSMSGANIEAAKKAAIMIDACCSELGIHDLVLSFGTGGWGRHGMDIGQLVDLERSRNSTSDNDAYKIAALSTRGGTPDWQCLEYASARLQEESTSGKIIFFISDGEGDSNIMPQSIKRAMDSDVTFIPVALNDQIQDTMINTYGIKEKDVLFLNPDSKALNRSLVEFGDKFVEELNKCVDKYMSE